MKWGTYKLLVLQQKGQCAICGKTTEDKLCVDHNHETGQIRELLCRSCNWKLHLVEYDLSFAKNAIKYLKKHKEK